jgi:hypothetical protein
VRLISWSLTVHPSFEAVRNRLTQDRRHGEGAEGGYLRYLMGRPSGSPRGSVQADMQCYRRSRGQGDRQGGSVSEPVIRRQYATCDCG